MKRDLYIKWIFIFFFGVQMGFAGTDGISGNPSYTWIGTYNSDWYQPLNWSPQSVPGSNDNVFIPLNTPYNPVLNSCNSVVCKSMVVEPGLKKSPAGGVIIISGGEVEIDGDLTIQADAFLIIESDGALTVNGATKINANGGMTIESGGSLITNGSITGKALVKRIIPDNLSWHFLSSPVDSTLILNGVFAPTPANFSTTPVTTWDFYKWMPNCPTPPQPAERWRNLRNTDVTINTTDFGATPGFEVKKGYLVAYGSGFATTKSFWGLPNTGDKTFSFSEVIDECSWVLAGNPFPSAFNWNDVTEKENLVGGYYYIWNENKSGGAGYEAYLDDDNKTTGVNGNIPSMQGFFVKVDPGLSKQIVVPNSSRVHDLDLWLKTTDRIPKDRLVVKLDNGSNFDEAIIRFGNSYNIGHDWYDAEKLFSLDITIPQVYTIVDNNQKSLINAMSYTENPVSIPVGFLVPADGEYTISVNGIESFGSLAGLVLEDLKENKSQSLLQQNSYTFQATGNEDAGRFILHFTGPVSIGDKNNSAINIYSNEKIVFVTSANGFHNARVTISNLLGQEVTSQKLNDQPVNQLRVDALKGYYIVKVQDDASVKTAKVYIN